MSAVLPAAEHIDRDRVNTLMERERARLRERTTRSGEYFTRASVVMPAGVPSSFQRNDPWPTYLERGEGSRVWDVDGNEYVDFHNGFGVMCVGHANPVIAAAVKARMDQGTHFAAPTEGSIVVAEELRRRWRLLTELDGRAAGVIMEPAMMNINIVPPVDGYLQRVREITRAHGVQLIVDEVKTGAAVAAGGATELFGVTPDIVCLAKAICGGLPGGAVGMTDALAELVESNAVRQQGTFNGNPLVMAAAQATLLEVLTPDAYA